MDTNRTFIITFGLMMATILYLSGCTTQDVYFRGECQIISHAVLEFKVYKQWDCSMPTESTMVEITGHPEGDVSDENTKVHETVIDALKDKIKLDGDEQ